SSPRLTSNASQRPSGDQQGQPANSLSKVNCSGCPPASEIVPTLIIPWWVKLKATCLASGARRTSSISSSSNSGSSFPCSNVTDHILRCPCRTDKKAICLPSGYQLGDRPPSTVI